MSYEEKREEFKKIVQPVIDFLKKNHSPHSCVVVTHDSAEVLSSEIAVTLDDE